MTVSAQPRLRDYRALLARRYRADPTFVYPDVGFLAKLLSGRAAFLSRGWAQAWLATDAAGGPAAFCVACIDPGLHDKTGTAIGSIAFFEAIDEPAGRAVLDAACESLVARGVTEAWAPFNANPYHGMGLREDHFDEAPFIACAHHPPEYQDFLAAAGFRRITGYLNFAIDLTSRPWERVTAAAVHIRPASRLHFRRDIRTYLRLHNAAFRTVWGEVEVGVAEGLELLLRSRLAVEPRLFQFAESAGEAIGFVWCMPNLSERLAPLHVPLTSARGVVQLARARRGVQTVGLLSLGVAPEHQGSGTGTALVATALRAAAELGFRRCEYALVAETNEPSKATAARFGGTVCRRFGIYARSLA